MTHIIHTDTKYCVVEEIQKHWLRNYLRKKYAKSPNGFAIKYQISNIEIRQLIQ